VDLRSTSLLQRITRHKRWLYVAIAGGDLFIGAAIVRLGYAASAFAFAFDAKERRMIADASSMGPPFAARVGDSAGEGCSAQYRIGNTRLSVTRGIGETVYQVEIKAKGLDVSARVESAAAPPSLTAVAPVPGGIVNTTEKRALLAVSGHASIAGARRSLDGGLAGYDYTNGLLARHTAWKWAFLLGRAKSGERVALNLVEGFVGEDECGVWIDGELYPLAEGRFTFDAERTLDPWRIETAEGAVDLSFRPGGQHAEHKDLKVVRSRFVQPVGHYTGTIKAGGKVLELEDVLGVAEDQDVLW
jgi:hypothetical protein